MGPLSDVRDEAGAPPARARADDLGERIEQLHDALEQLPRKNRWRVLGTIVAGILTLLYAAHDFTDRFEVTVRGETAAIVERLDKLEIKTAKIEAVEKRLDGLNRRIETLEHARQELYQFHRQVLQEHREHLQHEKR